MYFEAVCIAITIYCECESVVNASLSEINDRPCAKIVQFGDNGMLYTMKRSADKHPMSKIVIFYATVGIDHDSFVDVILQNRVWLKKLTPPPPTHTHTHTSITAKL